MAPLEAFAECALGCDCCFFLLVAREVWLCCYSCSDGRGRILVPGGGWFV